MRMLKCVTKVMNPGEGNFRLGLQHPPAYAEVTAMQGASTAQPASSGATSQAPPPTTTQASMPATVASPVVAHSNMEQDQQLVQRLQVLSQTPLASAPGPATDMVQVKSYQRKRPASANLPRIVPDNLTEPATSALPQVLRPAIKVEARPAVAPQGGLDEMEVCDPSLAGMWSIIQGLNKSNQ